MDLFDSGDFVVNKFVVLAAAVLIIVMELWAKEKLSEALPGYDDDVD